MPTDVTDCSFRRIRAVLLVGGRRDGAAERDVNTQFSEKMLREQK